MLQCVYHSMKGFVMASINQVTLLGNCTRDPELRYSGSGMAICQIGMAVNTQYGTGDDRKEETCFLDVVCFGASAEYNAQHLTKGARVLVTGRLKWETWEGQDGMKRSKHSVVAQTVHPMLVPTGEDPAPGTSAPAPPVATATETRAPRTRPSSWGSAARNDLRSRGPEQRHEAKGEAPEEDDIPF